MFVPGAPFIFPFTNEVYCDGPNLLLLIEQRCNIGTTHPYKDAIPIYLQWTRARIVFSSFEGRRLISGPGVWKTLRDVDSVFSFSLCMSNPPSYSGTRINGFPSNLMRCASSGTEYAVFGHKDKQVRDNLRRSDPVLSFQQFFEVPRVAAAYAGSGSFSDCSVLEAIELNELITNREMKWCFPPENRKKNHVWYISDWSKSRSLDPKRTGSYTVCAILWEIFEQNAVRRRCQLAAVA